MTEEEFIELFAECASGAIEKDFPKSATAASGGAASPGRGAAMVDAIAICLALTSRLRERGLFSDAPASDETAAIHGQI